MAAADATHFPVKGQAYRLTAVLCDSNNRPYQNLGTLSSLISKDGGAFAAGSAPVEIGTSGWVTLDLTAAQMTADTVAIQINASNEGAGVGCFVLNPLDLAEPSGHWRGATVVKLEQGLQHPIMDVANAQRYRYSDAQIAMRAYGGASSLNTRSFSVAADGSYEERGELA